MWQDQEAFDQRCDQNHADRKRNICDQIAKPTFDKRQRREGDDGCDGRGKHRQRHPAGRVFCCRFWLACVCPEIGVSPTTMASSTTILVISGKHRDHVQRNANIHIRKIAANIATGMPAATQKAVRAFRNKNSRPTTSARPVRPFSTRMLRRSSMASRVRIRSISTPWASKAPCPRQLSQRPSGSRLHPPQAIDQCG